MKNPNKLLRENPYVWACSAYSVLEQVEIYLPRRTFDNFNVCLLESYSWCFLVKYRMYF